jgi:serine/threonine protein kinase
MGIVNTAPRDELPLERLGDYDVLAPISEGGMASVWLGRATAHPDRLVALKVIRPEHGRNKEFVAMFMDESRIVSRLAHPNIVSIVGTGYDGKRHFLAWKCCAVTRCSPLGRPRTRRASACRTRSSHG